jgi:hypothetical protein
MFSDDISVYSPPRCFLSDDLTTDLASPEETLHPFVVVDHPGLTKRLFLYLADMKSAAEKEGRKDVVITAFFRKEVGESPPPPQPYFP